MPESSKVPVALVTGGSSGIGRATAIAFARAGAKTVVAARRIKESEEVVEIIRQAGGEAIFVQTDVSKSDDVKRLIDRTIERYGRLDWACNNAAIEGGNAPVVDYPEELWDQVININLKGVWLCMKYEIPEMLKAGRGAIVNISSVSGFAGSPGLAPYVASKHGVIGLTKSAAREYGKAGIRINTVCPGSVDTAMIERVDGGSIASDSWRNTRPPLKRIGNPEEIANSVLWLCSNAASYVTGAGLVVDGGLLALKSRSNKVMGVVAILGLLIGFLGGAMMWVPPFLPQRWLQIWVADLLVVVLTLGTVICLVLWAQQPGNDDRWAFVAAIITVGVLAVIVNIVAPAFGWWGGRVFEAPLLPLALLTGLREMFLLAPFLLVYRWVAAWRFWFARLIYLLIAFAVILPTVSTDEQIVRSGVLTFNNGYTARHDMLLAILFLMLPPVAYELFKRYIRALA